MFKDQHIHVIGKDNNIADSLSCKQFHRFRHLAPEADKYPESLQEEFLVMMSDMKLTNYCSLQQRKIRKTLTDRGLF